MRDVIFSSRHNNHELEPSPTGGIFEPVRVTLVRNVLKRGEIVPERETSPSPRVNIPKRGACSYLTVDHSVTRYILAKKKELSGRLGDVQEARQTLQILISSRFDKTGASPSGKSSFPPLSMSCGVYPFLSNSLSLIHSPYRDIRQRRDSTMSSSFLGTTEILTTLQ